MIEYLTFFDSGECTYQVGVRFLGNGRVSRIATRTTELEQIPDFLRRIEACEGLMTFDGYLGRLVSCQIDPMHRKVLLLVSLSHPDK